METARPELPIDAEYLVTVTLIVAHVARSVAFYRDVLEATVLREAEGEPTFLPNIWLTINAGGGPTDDKPSVTAAPPQQPDVLSSFINIRVKGYFSHPCDPALARRCLSHRAESSRFGDALLHP